MTRVNTSDSDDVRLSQNHAAASMDLASDSERNEKSSLSSFSVVCKNNTFKTKKCMQLSIRTMLLCAREVKTNKLVNLLNLNIVTVPCIAADMCFSIFFLILIHFNILLSTEVTLPRPHLSEFKRSKT